MYIDEYRIYKDVIRDNNNINGGKGREVYTSRVLYNIEAALISIQ